LLRLEIQIGAAVAEGSGLLCAAYEMAFDFLGHFGVPSLASGNGPRRLRRGRAYLREARGWCGVRRVGGGRSGQLVSWGVLGVGGRVYIAREREGERERGEG